jgi:phosphopantothenoylcysteine decarboxylase / phosphopantothenate---cysteine ligase
MLDRQSTPAAYPRTASEPPLTGLSPSRPVDASGGRGRKLLITAGPTHEPIDAVRFIGNRSSGQLGIALADSAAERGWDVRLLLGPTPRTPSHPRVEVERFQTTADLRGLLATWFPWADVLVMAAAVADFRPKPQEGDLGGKVRRTEAGLTIHLEPTPDLLAECAAGRQVGQLMVGFALEPRERIAESARKKLERKGVDLVVANPLETMDSPSIEAVVYGRTDSGVGPVRSTDGRVLKTAFAGWLLGLIEERTHA